MRCGSPCGWIPSWLPPRSRAWPRIRIVIRKAAAFEARYVRRKEVIQPLIDLLGDEEKFVAMSAVQSLWMLTRHETEFHDWDASNKQDRQNWAQEWIEWWNQSKETFEIPDPKSRKQAG